MGTLIFLLLAFWCAVFQIGHSDILFPSTDKDNNSSHHHHHHHHHLNNSSQTTSNQNQLKRGSKIAFMFLSRGEMPLEDVWHAFFDWHAPRDQWNIYIHTDPNYQAHPNSFFYGLNIKHQIKTAWASMDLVEATRLLVMAALEDPENEWFCLISESCIPLVPFQKWRKHMLNFNLSIVNACPYSMNQMEGDTRWKPSLDQVWFLKSQWRKSGQWFAIRRSHAEVFAKDANSPLSKAFRDVHPVDEHYLPSMLAYHGLDNETTCTDGFAHVFWPSNIDAHPKHYNSDEINAKLFQFMQVPSGVGRGFNLECSGVPGLCHFTARKFTGATRIELLNNLHLILSDETMNYTGDPWLYQKDRIRFNSSAEPGAEKTFYLIEHNRLRLIPNNVTLQYLRVSDPSTVLPITPQELSTYSIGAPYPSLVDGQVFKLKRQNWVFVTKNGSRHGIPDMDTFNAMGAPSIGIVSEEFMGHFPMGDEIPSVKQSGKKKKARRRRFLTIV